MKSYVINITLVVAFFMSFFEDLLAQTLKLPFDQANKSIEEIRFIENKGQVSDQYYNSRHDVLFYGRSQGLNYYLLDKGLSYQVIHHETNNSPYVTNKSSIYRIDIRWIGYNTDYNVLKENAGSGYMNFYLPSCPDGALKVQAYESIVFKNLYEGVDLKWHSDKGYLEYDFLLAPGADLTKIKWKVNGAQSLFVNDLGELVMETPFGIIKEDAPVAYQLNKEIAVRWKVQGNSVSFETNEFNSNLALVVDPGVRLWGTYYGGNGDELGNDLDVDNNGNIYLTGYTTSTNLIATSGAYQVSNAGNSDAFIAKFDSNGVRQWGTYYGGIFDDYGISGLVDNSQNCYLGGNTASTSMISTVGSHQSVHAGNDDVFMVKFNSAGYRMWATYIGGTATENLKSASLDQTANIYLTGQTSSTNQISTSGSHQASIGGAEDGFLIKFDSSGVRLWGTYIGGTSNDRGFGCATFGDSSVYVAGETYSTSSISSVGSHQNTIGGGIDGFLAKFSLNGTRIWSTYYGGSSTDQGFSCATDSIGNVYLSGATSSNAGIATSGSYQAGLRGGGDTYLAKFNSSGSRLWGTYYGGFAGEEGAFCSVDKFLNVYIAAPTASNSFIATAGSHQEIFGGGIDAFLVKFNSNGVRQWGTYFGGSGYDYAFGLNTHNNYVYISGRAASLNSISSSGSHQSSYGGGSTDAFLVKFWDCAPTAKFKVVNPCSGETTIIVDESENTVNGSKYFWDFQNDGIVDDTTVGNVTYSFPSVGIYSTRLKVLNSQGCADSIVKQVIVYQSFSDSIPSVTICQGDSVLIFGQYRNSQNMYVDSSLTTRGCDSITYRSLMIEYIKCPNDTIVYAKYNNSSIRVDNIGIRQRNNCNITDIQFFLSGATTGAGYDDASGRFLNSGITEVLYIFNDFGGFADTCSFNVIVLDDYVSVSENNLMDLIKIYPNPTSGEFNIVMHKKIKNTYNLYVTDELGKIVFERVDLEETHLLINLTGNSPGIYHLRIENKENSFSTKIVLR